MEVEIQSFPDFPGFKSRCKLLSTQNYIIQKDKAKPAARQGRKATGFIEMAGLPKKKR